jgi:CRISPR/Cas system-associated exonuclease Cas4 (RecB family)
MRLSKSKVNSFLKCRRSFKYQYIDEIEQEANDAMQLGTDVHQIAEDFIKKGGIGSDNYRQKLQELADDYGSQYDLGIHLDHLADFFNDIFKDGDMRYEVFSSEEYLYNEEYDISGLADLVVRDENNDIIIIDYKTGKSGSIKKYRLELCYYKLLLESKYPNINIIAAGIFFTKDGKTRFLTFTEDADKGAYCTEKDCKAAIDLLNFIREEINKGRLGPNRQFLCKYCSYQNICEKDGGF